MNKKVLNWCGVIGLAIVAFLCGRYTAPKAEAPAAVADNAAAQVDPTEYSIMDLPMVDISNFPVDKDGYITLFDGKTFNGWRGYGKTEVPPRWTIQDGCITFAGTGTGEGQTAEGGDLIFAHKFKDFQLELEWKISEGGNSGIFYLAQEVETKDAKGNQVIQPIYISAPEYQVLDNANHPDAKLGKDGNRQSGSLYDMIPAKPQTFTKAGEWQKTKIMVYRGTVTHTLNDAENCVEYHLWTPRWTEMLQASKFSQDAWPLAFELLNNLGGDAHEGVIGFQDHGDNAWYRNIRIKLLD